MFSLALNTLFKILNENIEIGYAHQEIEAIMVTDEISKYLNIKGQQPIFKVKTITYTPDAIPIFFDTSFYQDDKYKYSFPCMMSSKIIVYFNDGTQEYVRDALNKKDIEISDLDKYEIKYLKEEK